MKKDYNKKAAFTLAEILISLSILGIIVVVMTQILHTNVNKVETRAKLNAAHALISRAIIQYQAENLCGGNLSTCDEFINENQDTEQIYNKIFSDKFKVAQRCGLLVGLGCFSTKGYQYKDNAPYANPDNDENYYKVRLQNGMAMSFYVPTPRCKDNICMRFVVDTNGPAGPNTVNKDLFEGVVTTNQVKFETEE